MPQLNAIYKCNVCGNIVEMVHASTGQLVCCGQSMELKQPNTVDAAKEKHVPIVEISGSNVTVKIGETSHPMTQDHYIEWVEVMTKARVYRKTFTPGEEPMAAFNINEEVIQTRAYCNLHGLWEK